MRPHRGVCCPLRDSRLQMCTRARACICVVCVLRMYDCTVWMITISIVSIGYVNGNEANARLVNGEGIECLL